MADLRDPVKHTLSSGAGCVHCGAKPTDLTAAKIIPLVAAGSLAGSLAMTWRRHLSLKMNLLGWVYDRLELFPNQAFIRNQAESDALLKRCRLNWKMAEYLPMFEGPSVDKVADIDVPSRDQGRSVLCRVYRPKARGVLPVVIYLHGGGYSFGSVYVYDSLTRDLAQKSKCVVVSVNYRLSPEHKFPSGLNDCEDVLQWVASSPGELINDFQSDPTKVVVVGDSAGGNYTATVAVYAKNHGIPLALQCLLYPATSQYNVPHWRASQLPLPGDSAALYSSGPMLNYSAIVWGCRLYLDKLEDAYNPRASPILYTLDDLKGVAPAYMAVAGRDMLRDEGMEYAKKLRQAGVEVKLRYYHDTIHAFFSLHFCDHGSAAMDELCAAIYTTVNSAGSAL